MQKHIYIWTQDVKTYLHMDTGSKNIYIWTQEVKTYLHMDTGCKNTSTYGHKM